jgi:hypothetical protein
MQIRLLFIAATGLSMALQSCKGPGPMVITISPASASIASGTSTALNATLTQDGKPVHGGIEVDFQSSGCGDVSQHTVKTTGIGSGNTGDVPTVNFLGDAPNGNCTATITASYGSASNSCQVEVTGLPRVLDIPNTGVTTGTGTGGAPTVSITPNIVSKPGKGFSAKYAIASDYYPLSAVVIQVKTDSNFKAGTGAATGNTLGQLGINYHYSNPNGMSDTITIDSDSTKVGTADFTVYIVSTGSGRHEVDFSAGALKKAKMQPLPGPDHP